MMSELLRVLISDCVYRECCLHHRFTAGTYCIYLSITLLLIWSIFSGVWHADIQPEFPELGRVTGVYIADMSSVARYDWVYSSVTTLLPIEHYESRLHEVE